MRIDVSFKDDDSEDTILYNKILQRAKITREGKSGWMKRAAEERIEREELMNELLKSPVNQT